ncbi:MAG: hypothetical protein A2252_00245 [Elusimicrobia bacterium RIFOXYA2_FULL_39_19]|nr:MAG: hypothetical protein A2252_00245 [Elusimicrobia bacterium RIFOXYA2_FULL_39_19]
MKKAGLAMLAVVMLSSGFLTAEDRVVPETPDQLLTQDKLQTQDQLCTATKEMDKLCTATQDRFTTQEVNAICEAAKDAVEAGTTQREMVKLSKALMAKNITGQDLAATIDLVKVSIKEGLTPEEARNTVMLQAVNSLNSNQTGAMLSNQIAVALSARVVARGENLEEAKKMFLTLKEKVEEQIRENYGEAATPPANTPETGDQNRKNKR